MTYVIQLRVIVDDDDGKMRLFKKKKKKPKDTHSDAHMHTNKQAPIHVLTYTPTHTFKGKVIHCK